MSSKDTIAKTIRYDQTTDDLARELIAYVKADRRYAGMGRVSKTAVLRLAMVEGLENMKRRWKRLQEDENS